jgi:hypothetical protein
LKPQELARLRSLSSRAGRTEKMDQIMLASSVASSLISKSLVCRQKHEMANNGDEMLGSIDTSVLPFVDSLTLYFDAFFEHFDLSRFSVWKVNQYTHDCIEDCY